MIPHRYSDYSGLYDEYREIRKENDMPSKCTKCGDTEHYNFALNIGLCNPCIGERIDELEVELEKHRWIPVSERLPENGCCVNVIMDSGLERWGFLAYYNIQTEQWDSYDPMVKTPITHWKPIILP